MKVKPTHLFLALCGAAVLLVAGYALHVRQRAARLAPPPAPAVVASPTTQSALEPAPATDASRATDTPVPAVATASVAPAAQPRSHRVFFRYTGVDAHYGQVAWHDTAKPHALHFVESLNCEVVYVAGGRGVCLSADRGVFTTYAASLFDARTFAVANTFPVKGIPSRARVAIDGSLAALTVFVSGHGYSTLDFSTQTLLIDTSTGAVIADLEDFAVRRDGAVIKEADFNFWGVTFTPDAKAFYATLSTGGKHWLIRGDVAARTADVLHENVECPSLSPNARRVAYKKRLLIDNRIVWQLQVLELATGRETALSERRSIDDQLEWLDDDHVLYSVPSAAGDASPSTDVWIAGAGGAGKPRLFIRNAYSPATLRCQDPAACAAAE